MSMFDTLCPRPLDDVIVDKILLALTTYEAAQVALWPTVGFYVRRDQLRPYTQQKYPLVNVWSGKNQSPVITKKSGTETATINLDLFTRALDATPQAETAKHADQKNVARLLYLREQVKRALFDLVNNDFGLGSGVISLKAPPTWEMFLTEHGYPDDSLIAGRMTIDITYAWTPDDSAPTVAYELTKIDTDLFVGLYPHS